MHQKPHPVNTESVFYTCIVYYAQHPESTLKLLHKHTTYYRVLNQPFCIL